MQYYYYIKKLKEDEEFIFDKKPGTISYIKNKIYEILSKEYIKIDEYSGINDFTIDDLFETWDELLFLKKYNQNILEFYYDLIRRIDALPAKTKVARMYLMLSLSKLFLYYPVVTTYLEDKILLLAKVYETTPTLSLSLTDQIIIDENYYNEIINDPLLGKTEYDRILNQKLILEDQHELLLEKRKN